MTNTVTGRMTAAEDQMVLQLAERGWTVGRIAMKLNRHKATINWAMYRLGLKAPKPMQFEYVRNGRLVRSFSTDEDARIEELRMQGLSWRKIADDLAGMTGHQRTPASIGTRLKMLACLDDAVVTCNENSKIHSKGRP